MSKVVNVVVGAVGGFFTGGPLGAVVGAVGGLAQNAANDRRERAASRSLAEQRRANAINNAQQNLARQRQIRQAIAEQRVRRAQIEATAFSGGPEGAGQSITGDTGSAIGAANTQAGAAFGISQATDRASSLNRQAQSTNIFDTISGITSVVNRGIQLNEQGAFEGLFGESNG